MKQELLNVLAELDRWIENENSQRISDEESLHPKVLIRIYGQCSLILHPQVKLPLAGTFDFDASIESKAKHESSWKIQKKLETLLKERNLELESDIHLIWTPERATYTRVFESTRMSCEVLDPLYVLCSKAIKAKEKNRVLIREALQEYGKPLRDLIEKYGGSCDYFEA